MVIFLRRRGFLNSKARESLPKTLPCPSAQPSQALTALWRSELFDYIMETPCTPFQTMTAPISGKSPAQSYVAIKHVTIAVAELHQPLEELTDQPRLIGLHFMLHYGEAVSLIRKRPASLATEAILICCFLFATFETLQANPIAGLLHVEGRAKIHQRIENFGARACR